MSLVHDKTKFLQEQKYKYHFFPTGLCADRGIPQVSADMRDQLEWVKEITGDCNSKTCYKGRKCMKKKDLAPSVVKRFEMETPHL